MPLRHGLCGPLIGTYCSRLIGVDLSAGMLANAKTRDLYKGSQKPS